MKQRAKRIITRFAAAFMLCMGVLSPVLLPHAMASAEENVNFDRTNVLDDLQSTEGFSLLKYPFYESFEPEMKVIDFVEYCYDYRANMRGNYGLYLYVYNPNGQNIVTNSVKNTVQIAVAYDSDPITEKSNALNYEKFGLQFCSVSEGKGVNKLFYKFKVIDHKSADGKTIAERVNSMERRYDISGIELLTEGKPNATDYEVATSYHFSGYAEGYGEDGTGTTLKRNTLETVSLDLYSTTYRFPYINQNGAGHYNQLDSVYFAVPKEFNEKYGELYRVKCCWDEQKTSPVIMTNKDEVYSWASKWVGQKKGITDPFAICDRYSVVEIPVLSWLTSPPTASADWGWGSLYRNYEEEGHGVGETDGYIASIANNVIIRDDTAPGYVFPSDKSNVEDTQITAQQMKTWIYDHDMADYLFSDKVDEGRTKGYQEHTFTADEPFDMLSFNSTSSGWDRFCLNWGAFWTSFDKGIVHWQINPWDFGPEQSTPIDPIRLVEDKDFTGADAGDAKNLYVLAEDFDEFKRFYNANKSKNNVFLLRFAVTDYSCSLQTVLTNSTWYNPGTWVTGTKDEKSTVKAQETIFLDFDIIQLTFLRDTTETIIPVVASPIDIIGGISGSIGDEGGVDWWKVAVVMFMFLIVLIIVCSFAPELIPVILKILIFPFKLLWELIKLIVGGIKKAIAAHKRE